MESNRVAELLERASSGGAADIASFFRALLQATVWVPLNTRADTRKRERSLFDENNFLTVRHQGREILPIFSSEQFLVAWSSQHSQSTSLPFASLLLRSPDNLWLYLDAGQEIGKEISPWEVILLRQGEEAIPELVADLVDTIPPGLELHPEPDYPPEFEPALKVILESYSEVREAFKLCTSVASSTDSLEDQKLLIAIDQLPAEEDRRHALRDELRNFTQSFGIDSVITSVDAPEYRGLFRDRAPFYFRSHGAPVPPLESPTPKAWWQKIFSFGGAS